MEYNFAKKQVRRISRNKIFLLLILIFFGAFMVFVFAFSFSPSNLFFEYAPFDTSEEAEKLLEEKKFYVTTTAEHLVDTGYGYAEGYFEEGMIIQDKYYIFFAGEKYIICRVDKELSQEEYDDYPLKGKLDYATEVDAEVIDELKQDASEFIDPGLIADYIIDTNASRYDDQIIAIYGMVLLIIPIIYIFSAIISITDYKKNKYFKFMGANEDDAERINQSISKLYSRGITPKKVSSMEIIGDWMIRSTFTSFYVNKKEDVVWIFKTITKHKTNGIPTGKSYAVVLKGKSYLNISLSVKDEKKADALLEELFVEIPYAIRGYSDDLAELYKKNRSEFLELQVKHRQEIN